MKQRMNYYRRVFAAYLIHQKSHLTFWHELPEVNSVFQPGRLGPYYMLFREKADYSGGYDQDGIPLKTIASSGGVSGTHLGKKYGFEESTTDVEKIFSDREIHTVLITTHHDTHARFVIQALNAGKHVFVEKPLRITLDELQAIKEIYEQSAVSHQLLMVGFNQRFAPHVVKIKELLETAREPKSTIMAVNAGLIPPDHWTQDSTVGGGMIVGEVCHFIDLLKFLAGSAIQMLK
jgi:predicted dehydrogenase